MPQSQPLRLEVAEECSCGAKFDVIDDGERLDYAQIMRDLRAWRRNHRHDPQSGRRLKAIGFQQYTGADDDDEAEGRVR